MSDQKPKGIDNGLTNYGDPEFASFLRRSMARSMGVSRELLDKPVVGIAITPSEFNNCHRLVPELAEAAARCARRRCVAAHFPDDLARRGVSQSDQHGLPQSDVHGHRG